MLRSRLEICSGAVKVAERCSMYGVDLFHLIQIMAMTQRNAATRPAMAMRIEYARDSIITNKGIKSASLVPKSALIGASVDPCSTAKIVPSLQSKGYSCVLIA